LLGFSKGARERTMDNIEMTVQDRREEMEVYQRYLNGFIGMSGGLVSLPLKDLQEWEALNSSWKLFLEENGQSVNRMIRKINGLQGGDDERR